VPHNDHQEAFDFEDVASAGTGLTAPADRSEYEDARRLLICQSVEMEARLARVGIDIAAKQQVNVISIGNVSGTKQPSERSFRKCRFLPVVAKSERAAWLREIEYFLRRDPKGSFARYAVISTGERVAFDEDFEANAKAATARAQANIRRWISEIYRKYGIDVLLKTLEVAVDEETGHIHFNVIYIPRKRMSREVFADFLSFSRRRLGAHWRDCGRIRDLKEVIKYSTKITGPDSLEVLSDGAFRSMFNYMFRRTTIEAHGSFAAFRDGLKKNGRKVVWMRKPNAPAYLVVMRKQTRPRKPGPKPVDDLKENLILGRQLPRSMGAGLIEPVTIVQNYCENPKTEAGIYRLNVLRGHIEQATKWAAANGADVSPFTVHTIPATVQPPQGGEVPPEGVTTPGGGAGRPGDSPSVRAVIPPRPKTLNRPTCEPPRPRIMERGADGKWREARPKGRSLIPPRPQTLARPLCEPPPRRIMERGPDGRWRDAGLARQAAARRRLPPVRSFRPLGGG
jgi:hypothetical protein